MTKKSFKSYLRLIGASGLSARTFCERERSTPIYQIGGGVRHVTTEREQHKLLLYWHFGHVRLDKNGRTIRTGRDALRHFDRYGPQMLPQKISDL